MSVPEAWLVIGAEARRPFPTREEAEAYAGEWGIVRPLYLAPDATALREAEAAGAARENEAVVWLARETADLMEKSGSARVVNADTILRTLADVLERGDHRSRQSPEGWLANQRAG